MELVREQAAAELAQHTKQQRGTHVNRMPPACMNCSFTEQSTHMTAGGCHDEKCYTDLRRVVYMIIANSVSILSGQEIVVEVEPAQHNRNDTALADNTRKATDVHLMDEVVSDLDITRRMLSAKRGRQTVCRDAA